MYKAFYASFFLLEKGEGFDDHGRPINALRTFSTMIFNLMDKFNNSKMIIAFDQKGLITYRSENNFYKAGRSKMPDELKSQTLLISKMIDLVGIKQISSPSLEADDIIGILSKKFSKEGREVEIITSDKDLLQLVDENTNVHISKVGVSKMIKYTLSNFKDLYYGLQPKQVIDLKGIMGDTSDNLIGIKGIGEKGAVKLLIEYGTFEEIIKHKEELTFSIQKKIDDGYEMGYLCKEIATIIIKGNLNINFDELTTETKNKKELIIFLREYSVHFLANKLEQKW